MTTETTGFPALSGAAYRIQHPTLPLLLSDMSIPATDPGPCEGATVRNRCDAGGTGRRCLSC